MIRNRVLLRTISVFLLLQFSSQLLFPTLSYALTSGPSQPEFSSFEPVATTNMVNEFTGDFTYNLPVLEVPGPNGSSYPLSLSYHSGVTPEEEASWVGYGWTLNPGAINRGTRGLPDDYNGTGEDGDKVTFYNKMPKNWTVTVGGGVGLEFFGKDKGHTTKDPKFTSTGISLSANVSLRYNNYRGFGYNAGLGVSMGKGLVSMGYNVSDGEGSHSLNLNPYAILSWGKNKDKEVVVGKKRYFEEKDGQLTKKVKEKYGKDKYNSGFGAGSINLAGSSYGIFSHTEAARPNIVQSFSGKSFNVSLNIQGNGAPVPVGVTGNVFGSYAYQNNDASTAVPSYGYMYSGEAAENVNALMDYHVENEKDLNPRDAFLGVPFNDADNFMVTGEGIGGGFRMYNKTAGHFGPRKAGSNVTTYNIGGEIAAGWTFGPGADLGRGSTTLDVSNWSRPTSFEKTDSGEDEPMFFRFNNDLGGEWGTNHDDSPMQASFSEVTQLGMEPLPVLPGAASTLNMNNERSGRSSYIGYHTNKEITSNSVAAYSKIEAVNSLSERAKVGRENLIGELAVFNEAGVQYTYGLPVYSKNELSISYSARGLTPQHNFLAFTSSPNTDVHVGEKKASDYASTYLLTEIVTPDYTDLGEVNEIGENGSSPDDLGGYTRFNYEKKTTSEDWYVWRAPYRGLLYNKNSHSDPQDDMGSYSEGEKEIYYVHTIETKTHVALFVTEPRTDSREAKKGEFTDNNGFGNNLLEKLVRIELYSIDDFQRDVDTKNLKRYGTPTTGEPQKAGNPILKANVKPVKTVHFEYSTELMYDATNNTGLPNSQTLSGTPAPTGKLTLKKIYFEYNGIERAKISPYEFVYEYPSETVAANAENYVDYPEKYTGETVKENVMIDYVSLTKEDQNPAYSYFLSDAWGNYQKDGKDRFENARSWMDQKAEGNKNHFDPAAWHLKMIKLPSGGQIHVQYEQNDYSYVQDQEAHVMAGLSAGSVGNEFVIDLKTIGLTANSSQAEFDRLKQLFNTRYVEQGKKIYFKMLYSLIGNDNPDLATCNAEYIDGYASVADTCEINKTALTLTFQLRASDRLPREVCKDFVKAQRLGKVDPGANCDPSRGMSDPSSPKAIVNQLGSMIRGIIAPNDMCLNVDASHSYFRIPTPLAKKGGGVRVKRLMMYDKGFSTPVLYGNEYIYKTKDGERTISSGVATNEPQTIREENILVDFVARKGHKIWGKIVAGKDKDQAEGPLGESILPGPSIGYSKVIVKNIHSGKSNPGFSISEFYTAKDYPILLAHPDKPGTMTAIKRKDDRPETLATPFYSKVKNKTRATQGFSFVLNNMHGQVRSNASYKGTYDENANAADLSKSVVSRTSYEYFAPGEKIPMMSSLFGELKMKNPGREVDITFAQRQVIEKSNDVNVEIDLQVTVIPFFIPLVIPFPTAIPAFSYINGELNTHATTKVVRYPALVKKVEVYQDGIYHTQENLAFDEYTGKPVAVRSSDEFKGAYLAQSIPASWQYTEMSGKWKTQEKKMTGSFSVVNNAIALGASSCSLADFTTGDKIQLIEENATTGAILASAAYYVTGLDWINNSLNVEVASSPAVAGTYNKLVIIKTGRTNQLLQQAGAITTHNEVKETLAPISVVQAARYTATNFIDDLNARARNLTGSGTFELPGIYTEMNMTGFANKLSGCNIDLTKVCVKQLEYRYTQVNGQMNIELMSFDIDCTNTCSLSPSSNWTTIAAEGWE
jgi:hypothetical protein